MSGLTPLLSPSASGGRADEVVRRITEAIHLGLLADGERLPAETELAAQFGVAPMTMRDALAILRDEGLLVTKRGRHGGSFVQRPQSPPLDRLRQRLVAMTPTAIRDLVDEHAAVAGHTAKLAAERAAAPNVRRLFTLTEQLGSATNTGDRIRADCRFHIELAVASQSQRLTRHEVSLQAEVSGMLWLPSDGADGTPGPRADLEGVVAEHHEIATAVVAEDAERARRLAEAHVARNLRRLTDLHLHLTSKEDRA
ncbi:GntR family transcriptional regulator [Aeromicrobium flavum]|uniref:GntR family transcriptional regulator n=1 Tax=Aeromicrobium flavum TaxID=416568 RepID=A0A512HR18_9ACTN|nr:FCD domain-containing protein [Aeromicrobium flavum]GEO87904.1 GntR family transcriptional regulator [Aeromicrobium flavum]